MLRYEEYGRRELKSGAASRVAARSKLDLSKVIGVYGFELDSVKDELQDFYVGQTLKSMKFRWGYQWQFLKMKTDEMLAA